MAKRDSDLQCISAHGKMRVKSRQLQSQVYKNTWCFPGLDFWSEVEFE